MSTKQSRESLRVISQGKDHHIEVPVERAAALQDYLRSHGVWAGFPQPCSSGVDSVALARHADPKAVQALLDRWA